MGIEWEHNPKKSTSMGISKGISLCLVRESATDQWGSMGTGIESLDSRSTSKRRNIMGYLKPRIWYLGLFEMESSIPIYYHGEPILIRIYNGYYWLDIGYNQGQPILRETPTNGWGNPDHFPHVLVDEHDKSHLLWCGQKGTRVLTQDGAPFCDR